MSADHARVRAADTAPGGPATTTAVTGTATAQAQPTQARTAEADDIARERLAAADRFEAEQHANAQRRAAVCQRCEGRGEYRTTSFSESFTPCADCGGARFEQAIQFRITVTSPNGELTNDEVVPREEVIERLASLEFVTEQLPGWAITAEPIT